MTMPKGFVLRDDEGYELAIELDHSSEGLKQSAAQWTTFLEAALKKEGFKIFEKEPCLYKKDFDDGTSVYLERVVDDLFGVAHENKDEWVKGFVAYLEKECAPCKFLGEITSCLGVDIAWENNRTAFTISCERKINDLLKSHDLEDVKTRESPLEPGTKFDKCLISDLLSADKKQVFQSIVGSLLYIMRIGRPDLMFGVWFLACGMSAPTEDLWKQAVHILRYCKRTKDWKLRYSSKGADKSVKLNLEKSGYKTDTATGFCDSNWEPDKSVSSCVVMYNGAALTWRVRKQQTVALSSVEAELAAMSAMGQDIEFNRDIFEWFGMGTKEATTIFADNRGAIENARHPCFSDRLRHVNNKIFYIREIVAKGAAVIKWIAGTENPSDLGTKTIGPSTHRLFASFLMGNDFFTKLTANFCRKIGLARRVISRDSKVISSDSKGNNSNGELATRR